MAELGPKNTVIYLETTLVMSVMKTVHGVAKGLSCNMLYYIGEYALDMYLRRESILWVTVCCVQEHSLCVLKRCKVGVL